MFFPGNHENRANVVYAGRTSRNSTAGQVGFAGSIIIESRDLKAK
jgi:hypothetical protein